MGYTIPKQHPAFAHIDRQQRQNKRQKELTSTTPVLPGQVGACVDQVESASKKGAGIPTSGGDQP